MNSDNLTRAFLEAWANEDYGRMQDLSADDLSELEFSAVDVTGFHVSGYPTISETGCKRFDVDIDTPGDIHKLTITVIPKPGPFKTAHPYGVVSKSALEGLPKEDVLLSTNMTAKEAIKHINNSDDLESFVPEDEDRVTVLDALKNK